MLFKHGLLILIYSVSVYLFGIFIYYLQFIDILVCYNCDILDEAKVFDYIIVGSGSAGSIVARRLADDKNVNILVLEAGKRGNAVFNIPSIGLLLQESTFDWKYETIPQANSCFGLHNNVSKWPMGKILGGTGMLNNMLYVRGHSEDFNTWFKDKEGYSFVNDVLPYFKKLECWDYKDNDGASIYISELIFTSRLSKYILNGAKELGYLISNETENCAEGFGTAKYNFKGGQRWTPAHTLIEQNSPNVFLRYDRVVEKVLLHDNYEAYGVKYSYKGRQYSARSTKGVILSAGVVGTTKILLHTGIGPSKHLEDVNIEPKIDLPVGENLQDHVTTGLDLLLFNESLGVGIQQMLSPFSAFEYFFRGSGPWTTGGSDTLAYFNLEEETSSPVPDLQFMVMPVGINEDRGVYLRHLMGITDNVWDGYFAKLGETVTGTILPVLLHPKSRGNIRLLDNKFDSPVRIDPKYLSHQYDLDVLVKGIEIIRKLVNTKEMRKLGAKFNELVFPPCSEFLFDSKPYWTCYIKHLTITSYHPIGTCKMGHESDRSSVVNFDFQVKKTNNLYVVDASVMPTLTSGNINGAVFMLAEMASDILKRRDFLYQRSSTMLDIFKSSYQCY